MEIPATTERVPRSTAESVNERIQHGMESRLRYYAANPDEIGKRLRELDHEWDIERSLETNASALALTGLALSVTVSRKFLVVPMVVCGFLFQHAVQGWCPPLPVMRRMGLRTQSEIEAERYALKALRGDFQDMAPDGAGNSTRVQQALRAVGH